ncbi:hypothetical protein G7Y89_g2496 [Cudoniella acicularis]|uniref:Major facilitator superfamily (MFS) profile domain-containing protein n=1 Tax=Cudoniella acicularis TaxID=354080 RepID=A0A8H4W6W6_9HELO|nr:hypothetical protein G7Y89_g2496 [Cudoniella acicularis]
MLKPTEQDDPKQISISQSDIHPSGKVGPQTTTSNSSPSSKSASISSQLGQETQKRGWFHWHEPGTSKAEKRLIFKLDFFLLTYGCLCFFNKYLDQTNISNAYVSGMSSELHFGAGNELSWMNTYFNAGYIIGGPLSNLILTLVAPRIWLPSCMSAWSIFVLFLYKCNTAKQLYALRFFIGFFESAAFPGIHYVLGSWFKKSELARRSSLFVISGVLGQMFSGYLQAALYTGMERRGGLSAWRWLFIFDFVLAVPIALYGFFFFPDTPETTKAFYLNEWERKRAIERIEEEGRTPVGKMDVSVIKRIALSWQLWTFSIGWALWCLTCGSYIMQFFTLWLKAQKTFSVPQINNIPTSIGAVNFFFMIATGFLSDKLGARGPVCLGVGVVLTFCFLILTIWDVPTGLKMAAYILSGCYGCFSPLMAGWVNSVCGGD